MKIIKVLVLLVLFLLSSFAPSRAGARSQQESTDFTGLEKIALEELTELNIPGAAMAIVSGGRVVFSKGFGVSNIETGAAVTPDMLFRIGSVNKMFTAALLVMLAEEGRVKLDEPIGSYIKGLNPGLARLTAHQLLSHMAGLRNEEAGALQFGPHDERAMASAVGSWKDDRFFAEPGRVFSYSNDGYVLAGILIETVGGKPYADQMSERLFKPFGMSRTTFRPTVVMTYPFSQGHLAFGKAKPAVTRPFADNAIYWPAGFMFSSVNELARFAIAFMDGGKIDGREVISPRVIAKMATPGADIPLAEKLRYGYGLMLRDHRGVRLVEHAGGIAGFGAHLVMSPDHRFAVIVLANKFGAGLPKSEEKALEMFLPLQPKQEEEQEKAKPGLPISEAEMANAVGAYSYSPVSHPAQTVELLVKEGKLFVKAGSMEAPLTKIGENSYFTSDKFPIPAFTLVPGAGGKAEFLHFSFVAFKRIR